LKERAADAVGRVCCFCGSVDNLEYAHVLPTGLNGMGRGLTVRMLDVIRHPLCYRRMCKPCHADYDERQTDYVNEIPD
jgi:hypothetical protein